MPKISVVMPVYNTDIKHLHQAITSILSQSFTDFEFIILNDSPYNEQIKDIISTYKDHRIIYHETKGDEGISKSYNHLLDMATSKYIALMNHDDISHKHRLKKQYEYLEKHKDVSLLGTAFKKFGEINRFKTITLPSENSKITALLLFRSPIHHPTIMFRREIAIQHKIRYNENFISLNDRQLYYDFSKYTKLANLKDVLYQYRFHKNMTSKKKKETIRKEQAIFHKLWFAYNAIELTEEETDLFDNYITNGRCRIKDKETLVKIKDTLEKLAIINQQKQIIDVDEFNKICGKYLIKRCLNGAWYGKIATQSILKSTTLPIRIKPILHILNVINTIRGGK